MKKEIQIAAKLNFEDFDKTVGDLQRKLKDLYAPSNAAIAQTQMNQRLGPMGLGSGAAGSPASQAAYKQQTQQARREMDQAIAAEARGQEKLSKLIAQRASSLKEMQAQQKAMVKDTQEELAIREKIARVQENNARMMDTFKAKDRDLGNLVDVREKMRPQGFERLSQAYQKGGLSGAATAGQRMFNQMPQSNQMAMGAAAVGGYMGFAGSVGLAGNSMQRYFTQTPLSTMAATGSAANLTYGREIDAAYAGRSGLEGAYLPEKAAAAQRALENNNMSRQTQGSDIGFSALQRGGAGVALGGGALKGGMPGAIAGGVAGVGSELFSQKTQNYLMDKVHQNTFGLLGKTGHDANEAQFAQQFAEEYAKNVEDSKNSDSMKTKTREEYGRTYLQNLDFQRQTGFTNKQFYGKGGFQDRAIDAGFFGQQAMDSSRQMLASGGSTRMASDPRSALQAERGYGITNASSILGKISSGIGDTEASKKAFIDMIAEGQRLGLDSSRFAEENRKFLDATSQIISNSGARGQGAEDQTKSFGEFIADRSTKGIEGAQSAFQNYTARRSATSGMEAVARFAAYKQDPVLSRLSGMEQTKLFSMPDDQVNVDDPAIKSFARKAGRSPQEIVDAHGRAGDAANSKTADSDRLSARVIAAKKELPNADPKRKSELQKIIQEDIEDLNTNELVEHTENNTRFMRESNVSKLTGGTFKGSTSSDDVQGVLDNKNTGRVEDATVQANAEGTRLFLTNMGKMEGQLTATAEQVAIFNKMLERTAEIASKLSPEKRHKVMGAFEGIFDAAKTATVGGKPK